VPCGGAELRAVLVGVVFGVAVWGAEVTAELSDAELCGASPELPVQAVAAVATPAIPSRRNSSRREGCPCTRRSCGPWPPDATNHADPLSAD
jgi:hypothetical protein